MGCFPNIPAKFQHCRNTSLAVHNSAGPQRITHALIYTIFQGYINIKLESIQSANPYHIKHIFGIFQGFPPVCSCLDFDFQAILVNIPLAKLGHHIQISLVYIGKSHLNITEFLYRQEILQQPPGKSNTTCSDKCNFKRHCYSSF
jgi:hypothetical protein